MVKITVHAPGAAPRELHLPEGLSLMEGLRSAGVAITGDCEGSLACSSCHVWIEPDWLGRLKAPEAEEEDLLDVAFHLSSTSRLACQIRIDAALDGLGLRLPLAPEEAP